MAAELWVARREVGRVKATEEEAVEAKLVAVRLAAAAREVGLVQPPPSWSTLELGPARIAYPFLYQEN